MTGGTLTYVYSVVQGPAQEALAGVPPGLPGTARPRLLAVDPRTFLVVGDAPVEEYSAERVESRLRDMDWVSDCAVAHEAVVEHFLGSCEVVPMKLFTLFRSDERALADLSERRETVAAVLARIRGCREWGLRGRRTKAASVAVADAGGASSREPAASAGTAFLMRKKEERDARRRFSEDSERLAQEVFHGLAALARDARRSDPAESGGKLFLEAAFLVPDHEAAGFRDAVQRKREECLEAGVELTLSGPWPAYNFIGTQV